VLTAFSIAKKNRNNNIYTMVNLNISPSMLFSDTYDEGNQRVAHSNVIVIVVLCVILVLFYMIFQSLGKGGGNSVLPSLPSLPNMFATQTATDKGLNILEIIMWGSLIFLFLINGLHYFFGMDINTSIKNIFSRTPEIDVSIAQHGDEGKVRPSDPSIIVNPTPAPMPAPEQEEEEEYEYEDEKPSHKHGKDVPNHIHFPSDGFCQGNTYLKTKKKCEEKGSTWISAFCRGDRTIKTRVGCEEAGREWIITEESTGGKGRFDPNKGGDDDAGGAEAGGGPRAPDDDDEPNEEDGEKWGGGTGSSEIMLEKQVFHIPVNKYTYKDARAMCGAFGGRLASYNEIEEAYKKGAEWCSYGWSKGQNIYYPTQKKTYKKLQKIKGHKHDCGRPGINGGYISNPNAKFGVNCYAPKPNMGAREQEYMESLNTYPITKDEKDFKKKVTFYKDNLNKILVSPFNRASWSQV